MLALRRWQVCTHNSILGLADMNCGEDTSFTMMMLACLRAISAVTVLYSDIFCIQRKLLHRGLHPPVAGLVPAMHVRKHSNQCKVIRGPRRIPGLLGNEHAEQVSML